MKKKLIVNVIHLRKVPKLVIAKLRLFNDIVNISKNTLITDCKCTYICLARSH